MKEAFERFDYKEDDVLPRREQVKMFLSLIHISEPTRP